MTWGASAQTAFASGEYAVRTFVRIDTKTLAGNPAVFGYWSGVIDRTFDLGDGALPYYGVGGALDTGGESYRIGTNVQSRTISMDVNDSADALIRQYQIQGSKVTIHRGVFSIEDATLIQARKFYTGFVDTAPIITGGYGGTSKAELSCVSAAWRGTISNTQYKSDAAQKRRSATDTFRAYNDLGVTPDDEWNY